MSEWMFDCLWCLGAFIWAALLVLPLVCAVFCALPFYLVHRETKKEARNARTRKAA